MEVEIRDCGQSDRSQSLKECTQVDLSNIRGAVHFIGVGGIGMSAIARLLLEQGMVVSGSDREANSSTRELERLGARIYVGHRAENVEGAGAIIVSTAITADNPEVVAASAKALPVWHRSQLLAWLSRSSKLVAVSGTHGKTTTTAMVAQVLLDGGLNPSVVIGGIFSRIASNSQLGSGEYFVSEADESDGTHANAASYMAVVTNIEADHLENYPGGIEQIRDHMASFANQCAKAAVLCQDDLGCRLIRSRVTRPVITYGLAATSADADYTYESLPGFAMRVLKAGVPLGEIALKVPGEHNKLDALAAAVVGLELGLTFETVARALSSFAGVARRFQIIGQQEDITVIDDYAHHPTEVAATLKAAVDYIRQQGEGAGPQPPTSRVVAVFQPHQPRRLKDLWEEFCRCFDHADLVIITDVYIARGQPIEGITSKHLVSAVRHADVRYIPGAACDLAKQIVQFLQPGDLVLTIGAGDITKVGPEILRLVPPGLSRGRDS